MTFWPKSGILMYIQTYVSIVAEFCLPIQQGVHVLGKRNNEFGPVPRIFRKYSSNINIFLLSTRIRAYIFGSFCFAFDTFILYLGTLSNVCLLKTLVAYSLKITFHSAMISHVQQISDLSETIWQQTAF